MNGESNETTAILATAFSALFLAADDLAHVMATLDDKTAREAAILFRVLENRLRDARQSIACALSPPKTAAREVVSGEAVEIARGALVAV